MTKASQAIFTDTVIATAVLTNNRLVNQAGAFPAAGALAYGVTRSDAAIGDPTPVDVMGTAIVEAGAAFGKDVALMVGTTGKAIAHDNVGSKHAIGRSLEASTGDGALVEILLVPSSGLAVNAA